MAAKTNENPFRALIDHIACNHAGNGAIDCVLFRDEVPEGFSRIMDFHIPADLKADLSMGMLAKVLSRDIEPGAVCPSTVLLKSGVRVGDLLCDTIDDRPITMRGISKIVCRTSAARAAGCA
ncbi:hypothetical protein [Methanoregula formicica]|uniref:hypothetical protein n=1 Tax=Methanoregula formicica TaxID=882104 RepID=UPI00064F4C74|nr:hypothetical protein [Methanoregula formicica]